MILCHIYNNSLVRAESAGGTFSGGARYSAGASTVMPMGHDIVQLSYWRGTPGGSIVTFHICVITRDTMVINQRVAQHHYIGRRERGAKKMATS